MSDQRAKGRSLSVFRYTWDISQHGVCIALLVSQWGGITEGMEAAVLWMDAQPCEGLPPGGTSLPTV